MSYTYCSKDYARSIATRPARVMNIAIFALISLICNSVTTSAGSSVTELPDYRYPADTSGPGLRLISLLHDTKAKKFVQGTCKANDKHKKSHFARPRYLTLADNGRVLTLDGARGIIFQSVYESGALLSSTQMPIKRRAFLSPIAIATTPDGSVWVTDSRTKTVFIMNEQGEVTDSLIGMFKRPVGIAFNSLTGNMLVTDLASNSIFEISLDHEIIATHGSFAGNQSQVEVEGPSFITVGPTGEIYIVEALGGGVAIYSPQWEFLRRLGGFGDGPGFFSKPKGIAVDKEGRVYVADALFDNVQIFDNQDRLLLTLGSSGTAPGQFLQPMGIALDENGDIYIADSYNGRVQVFRWENIDK